MKTKDLASGAICSAISLLFLFITTFIPSGKISTGFIAAFIPCILYIESKSIKTALISGISTALVGLILLPKSGLSGVIIILYCVCFCYYPALKALIEKKKNFWLEWLYKEIYFIIISIIISAINNLFAINLFNMPIFIVSLTLYDILISYLIGYYIRVISPKIRKG